MPRRVERTDPELWEAIKREVTRGDKGGKPGQWSARKAQLAVAIYKQRGGGYLNPKDPTNSLTRWTRQDWRTKSGLPSLVTGERYLPAKAISALSASEYAATTRAKRAGMRRGEQFVKQPAKIAQKVTPYRKNNGGEERTAVPRDEYLYHATHLGKAEAIAKRGLMLSGGSQFSGGYTGHSRGRVFLTDFDGLSYWMNKMEQIAEYNSDFHEEDDVAAWTPVALRILIDDDFTYFVDELGNRDNRMGKAYYTKTPIPPDYIEIWDGSSWVEIGDADLSELSDTAISAAEFEYDNDDDDEEEEEEQGWDQSEDQGYFLPNFDLFLPTEP